MRVRCPHCNTVLESMDQKTIAESLDALSQQSVHCSSCGEEFSLIGEETQTYEPRTGRMVGHFRLLEVVGNGAFGVVWRALDTELDRIVAVKTPRSGVIAPSDVNQFMREAQAAAQLQHANIVSVHEIGRIDDFLYIISDFVDGVSLSNWFRANRPTSRESAQMCVTISEALDHAHRAGVVHRDMKPGNILIDSTGSPKIVDFGLAKREVGDMTLTFDGKIVGTPAYMSPEQATGDASLDHRSDLYSMGVILFEMLTGEKPFRGNHRMLLLQMVHDDPPSPRRLVGSIPRDLETICLKCLEKSPARRYQSAAELADDLRRFLAGEPIHARPIGSIERMRKWAVRRPLVASLLTGIVLAVVLGLSGVTWQWRRVVASQRRHALTQVELIRSAKPGGVESAIDGLRGFRDWADPELRRLVSDGDLPAADRFRVRLALVEHDPEHIEYVVDHLLRVAPPDVLNFDEVALGTDLLARNDALPRSEVIELATDAGQDDALRFRALFMLARTAGADDEEEVWVGLAPFAVRQLVARATAEPGYYRTLVESFRPVHAVLLPAFREHLVSDAPNQNERFTAASMIGEYAADNPEFLCDLLLEVEPEEYGVILPHLRGHHEFVDTRYSTLLGERRGRIGDLEQENEFLARQSVAAVTLLHLVDEPSGVWPLFRQSPDMTMRTLLIHRCAEFELPAEILIDRLDIESDVSVRRALLLALGGYDELEVAVRSDLRPKLENLYREDEDAGVHSAIAWIFRRWDEGDAVWEMDAEPTFAGPVDGRDWYVNSQGATMVVIDHPPVFMMGAPEGEPLRTQFDRQHLRRVNRRFAIAAREVTWEEFREFSRDYGSTNHSHPVNYGPDLDGPVLAVSWVHAVKFCRWLSEQEGIDADQMCFPELDAIHAGMSLRDDIMDRTGYRLPSEGEWECACRAGTVTRRFFGDCDAYLGQYGWHIGNSNDFVWRAGLLKPNDYGLFDLYGNAWEWCLDRHGSLPTRPDGVAYDDAPKLVGTKPHILRGGSMNSRADALRSAQRDFVEDLHDRNHNVGFRIVRTLPPDHGADTD